MSVKLSAFVITYNRAWLLETCLRGVSFADELIVVDKSSTDGSAAIAARYADRVEIVPWSPTVEETHAFAASLCTHEWILYVDDDEILSSGSEACLRGLLASEAVDIYNIPYRHYILGTHDERAYYWPETRHCLFRKGAIEFTPTVHGGVVLQSGRVAAIPVDSGVCIHHLSYQSVASWIERTNRYTDRPDRVQVAGDEDNLIRFAQGRIDYWMQRTTDLSCNDYPTAVALLRAVYDMVDRLKTWENNRGLNGAELFQALQKDLVLDSTLRFDPVTPEPASDDGTGWSSAAGREHPVGQTSMEMQSMLVQARSLESQLRSKSAAAEVLSLDLTCLRNDHAETIGVLAGTRSELQDSKDTLEQTKAVLEQTKGVLEKTKAALEDTRGLLDKTQKTVEQTQATLGQQQSTLEWTEATLKQTRAALSDSSFQLDKLSNSARVFVRQYLPKLRRYLLRRLGYDGGARS